MQRNYLYLKLRRIHRFRNVKRATRLYQSLEGNMHEYKRELVVDFEDKLHVTWSWKVLSLILGMVFLSISIINFNHFFLFILFMAISSISITISFFLQNRLESIHRGYILGLSIVDDLIQEEQDKIRLTYNQ